MNKQVNLIRASAVGGLPVVTIDSGEDAAEIKDVVYDAAAHHLVGFTLNKRGWFRGSMKAVLSANSIESIGADAVMVSTDEALTDAGQSPAPLAAPNEAYDVMGASVMSSAGVQIGTVIDVIIETGVDPTAVGYEVETDTGSVFVPSSAQMGLSGENLIVPAEADEFVTNDLAGFGAAVSSFRNLIAETGNQS